MSGQAPVRWRRRKHARPREILQAALACFKERGFAGTRLEDVAAEAGVTKGTIYLYYPSKVELFEAVVRTELVPNIDRVEAAVAAQTTAVEQLEQIFLFAERVAPSPLGVLPKIVIAEAGNFPELARFYFDAVPRRMLGLVASIIRRGITSGEFRYVDVDHVVFSIVGPLVLTLLWQHSLGPHVDRRVDASAVCRAHLDLVLRGLRAAPRSARRSARERHKR